MNLKNKVLIYGGSFNPPTIAHVIMAKYLMNELEPKELLVVPTYDPPHKKEGRINVYEKFDMVKETFEEIPGVHVTDVEYKLRGVSYTYKTIETLREKYDELYLVMGMDSFLSFPKWVKPERILELANIIVLKRGGYTFKSNELYEKNKEKFFFLDNPVLEMSSTFVREQILEEKDVRFFVTDRTYDYINEILK